MYNGHGLMSKKIGFFSAYEDCDPENHVKN